MNGAGFYIYYVVELGRIHAEMRSNLKRLPDHQLDMLRLTNYEFLSARIDDHELMINGKMYDISRVEYHHDVVHVYCLHDEKEDNLLALIGEIISKPRKKNSNLPDQILSHISTHYILPESLLFYPCIFEPIIHSKPYQFFESIRMSKLDPPPPRQDFKS